MEHSLLSFILLLSIIIAITQAACPDIPTLVVYLDGGQPSQYVSSSSTSSNKVGVVKSLYNNPIYQDRDYDWVQVPLELLQAAYGSLYNGDKSITTNNYVTYTFAHPHKVWIAFDSRATQIPTWAQVLGFQQTTLTVTREDNLSPLLLNVYTTSSSYTSITLGGASSPGANSMYIPFFTLAAYSCSAESFSDNFFGYYPPVANGPYLSDLDSSLYLSFQYYDNFWQVDKGNLVSTPTAGYKVALTLARYLSTTFTLRTRAQYWHSSSSSSSSFVTTRFVFGTQADLDPFNPYSSSLESVFSLYWNSTTSRLILTSEYYGPATILASVPFTSGLSTEHNIKIERTFSLINVYVDSSLVDPPSPLISVTISDSFTLGRFGWISHRGSNGGQVTLVDYLHMTGRACKPYGV